ncbi:MAG TPA: hypothetical protein VFZ65_00165 [Planctomycetota bacterium]|nr:hypothetical protein [Planctomycetota bacterium]
MTAARRKPGRSLGTVLLAVTVATFAAVFVLSHSAAAAAPRDGAATARGPREPARDAPPEVLPTAPASPPTTAVAAPARRTASTVPAPGPTLGDLVVAVDAPSAQHPGVPVALTWTTAQLDSEALLQQSTDEHGVARFPRQLCTPRDPSGILCVDVGFPSIGAYALQLEPTTEQVRLWAPARGTVHIEVVEADGAPLRCAALAELRVLQATPPADRRHAFPIADGHADAEVEAAALSLLVQVGTRDGRRPEPIVITGPARADEIATCVIRLLPRTLFAARVLDPWGRAMADTGVEVWLADTPVRLDEGLPTDARGVVRFPGPTGAGGPPAALWLLAHDAEARQLHGTLLADLHAQAESWLGDVQLQESPLLVAGVCFDADRRPATEVQLVVQVEVPEARRRPHAFGSGAWRDLSLRPTTPAADGTFRIFGPPQAGARLRLRARGLLQPLVPFAEGASGVQFVLRRNGPFLR